MKITCDIQNNVITLNYAGIGISIDPDTLLNSADKLINIVQILPLPEDIKKDMLKDTDQWKQYLPIFRKFVESLQYQDCSATIYINDDGKINLHQTEVSTLFDLPKFIRAMMEFQELENKISEERRIEREKRDEEFNDKMQDLRSDVETRYDSYMENAASFRESNETESVSMDDFEKRFPNATVVKGLGDE
jgi:hypothetical protein